MLRAALQRIAPYGAILVVALAAAIEDLPDQVGARGALAIGPRECEATGAVVQGLVDLPPLLPRRVKQEPHDAAVGLLVRWLALEAFLQNRINSVDGSILPLLFAARHLQCTLSPALGVQLLQHHGQLGVDGDFSGPFCVVCRRAACLGRSFHVLLRRLVAAGGGTLPRFGLPPVILTEKRIQLSAVLGQFFSGRAMLILHKAQADNTLPILHTAPKLFN
mmetsp:Transcript_75907/g.219205  ORF Transcript_75907/g.219205 Transcript_75907/m.219205 type:complete len:220 (-) Transcript_75907:1137-1796(-)